MSIKKGLPNKRERIKTGRDKKLNTFPDSSEIGAIGEEVAWNWLHTLTSSFIDWDDVREDPYYREIDVDFLAQDKNGIWKKFEAKADTYWDINFAFEKMANIEEGKLGCMLITEADYILYYFISERKLYVLEREPYVNWVKQNYDKFRHNKDTRNYNYTTENCYVPINMVKEYPFFKKVIPFKEIEE